MANKARKTGPAPRYTWAPAIINGWETDVPHPVIFDAAGNHVPATHNPNAATGALHGWDVARFMPGAYVGPSASNTTYLKGRWANADITVVGPTRNVPAKFNADLDRAFRAL